MNLSTDLNKIILSVTNATIILHIFKDRISLTMKAQKQKSWLGRNWLWLLPVSGCLTVILLFVFGVGAIFLGVTKALKNATPYEYAIELAKNNNGYLSIHDLQTIREGIEELRTKDKEVEMKAIVLAIDNLISRGDNNLTKSKEVSVNSSHE